MTVLLIPHQPAHLPGDPTFTDADGRNLWRWLIGGVTWRADAGDGPEAILRDLIALGGLPADVAEVAATHAYFHADTICATTPWTAGYWQQVNRDRAVALHALTDPARPDATLDHSPAGWTVTLRHPDGTRTDHAGLTERGRAGVDLHAVRFGPGSIAVRVSGAAVGPDPILISPAGVSPAASQQLTDRRAWWTLRCDAAAVGLRHVAALPLKMEEQLDPDDLNRIL